MQPESQDGSGGAELSDSASSPELAKSCDAASAILYDAFISYSHAADGRLAPELRSGLQRFATPWRLFRLTNPVRSLRIFQDTASLSANPELWPTIERALVASKWFVLLGSPDAAASPWVGKEVKFWCQHKSPMHLLIVQTAGEISWDGAPKDFDWTKTNAVPQVLSGAFREEPRWVDARFARTEKQVTLRDPRFRDLVAEIAAPLRGLPKDDLIGEDIRQHRRLNFWRNTGVAFLTALLIVATWAAVIAIQKRNEAEQNFSHAVNTADTLVSEVATRLKPLAGIKGVSADSVREILAKAEESYKKLMALRPPSPALQEKLAVMLMAFADIYAELGKTNEQAQRAQRAHEIMQRLVNTDPENVAWQRDLAVSNCTLGDALKVQNKLGDALVQYRAGLLILEPLDAQDPRNTRWKRDLLSCYGMMDDALRAQGDLEGALAADRALRSTFQALSSRTFDEARLKSNFISAVAAVDSTMEFESFEKHPDSFQSALRAYTETVKGLLKEDPDNPQRRDELASTYISTGDFKLFQRDFPGALQAYCTAEDIRKSLVAQDPRNVTRQQGLAWIYQSKGRVLGIQNDFDGALKAYNDALTLFEGLAAHDPTNAGWQHGLAETNSWIGHILVFRHDYIRALAVFRTAEQIHHDLHLQDPGNIYWKMNLASTHEAIGGILLLMHDYDGALTEYDARRTILDSIATQNAANFDVQSELAENLYLVGIVKGMQGDRVAEMDALRAAQGIWGRLRAGEPHNPHLTKYIMHNYNAMGDSLRDQGDLEGALAAYRQVQSMQDGLTSENVSDEIQLSRVNHLLQAEVGSSYNGIGQVLHIRRDLDGALTAYRTALEITKAQADKGQYKSLWESFLEGSYAGITRVYYDRGDRAKALEAQHDLKQIIEQLVAQDPSDMYLQSRLALNDKLIGAILWEQGDQTDALEAFRQWVAVLRRTAENSKNRSELADALGNLSWYYLLTGKFADAKAAAEEGYSLDNQQVWILANLANAQMFLGHMDVATDIHNRYKDQVVLRNGHEKRWPDVVSDDFTALRKAGFAVSDMIDIEHLLRDHK
jgi:tetratricopeptide (TPR) repeat protein